MKTGALRIIGLGLAGLCAAFWLWFGIASAVSERQGPVNGLLHLLVPGGIVLMAIIVALLRERLGGALLLALGILAMVLYLMAAPGHLGLGTIALVLATMALPPMVAGILLLLDARGRARPLDPKRP